MLHETAVWDMMCASRDSFILLPPRNKGRLGQSARVGPFYLMYFVRAVDAGERQIRGFKGILLLELANKVVL